jgi:hypothetical protein
MLVSKNYKENIHSNIMTKIFGIFLFTIVFTLLLNTVSANGITISRLSYNYKEGSIIDVKNPCYYNGAYCPVSTVCMITIFDSENNKDVLVSNQNMTYQVTYFNYTLPDTNYSIGSYPADMVCTYNGNSGSQRFYLDIGTGYTLTIQSALMYIFLILCLGLTFTIFGFYVFNSTNRLGYRVALFNIDYFVFIVLMFFIWKLTTGYLPDINFLSQILYYLWVIPLLISWIMILVSAGVLINSALAGKKQDRLIQMGYSEDEAKRKVNRR